MNEPTPHGVTAHFVDGPWAGDTRIVPVAHDGEPAPVLTLPGPMQEGRLTFAVYDRVSFGDPTAEATRYRFVEGGYSNDIR